MRTFILSAAIAILAATSFAAPSQAGGWGHGWGHSHNGYNNGHHGQSYGGYQRVYDDYSYEPSCRYKKIKKYDRWGNVFFKTIEICR